jgi:hypothetical protein
MLTSFLLAALLPLQDAPAQTPPAAPPAAAPAAEAVPTETPENVRKFLQEAESHLYDPQAAGLSSMEFDVAIDHPTAGPLGNAHVTWTATGGVDVQVTPAEGAKLPESMVQGIGQQFGVQLLGAMLNKPITPMLEGSVASMGGVEDGLVKVAFHNAAAMAQGLKEQSLFFDDAGLLQRMKVVQEVQGTKLSINQSFQWRPVAEGKDVYVASSQHSETTAETPMGPMKIPGDTSFTYVTVGEIVLPTSIATSQEVPVQGKVTQTLAATHLKVNGQAVGG